MLPDANAPISIRSSGIRVAYGSTSALRPILDTWLAAHADGTARVTGTSDVEPRPFRATSRARPLTPELPKGLEFDLVILVDLEASGTGIQGAVDRYVGLTGQLWTAKPVPFLCRPAGDERDKTLGMLEWGGFQGYVEVMNKVASKHFGEVELNHGREHNFTAMHELAGHPVELDLNVNAHDRFDEAALHKVDYRLRFLPEVVDQVREMIAEELEQEGTSAQEYRQFHCNAIKNEHLQKVFGISDKDQLTNDVFLKALKLGHVGIYPGQPERYFVLDFTLGAHFTDEVLVASADEDGVVDDEILWES